MIDIHAALTLLVVPFVFACSLMLALIPMVTRLKVSRYFLDHPNARKIHSRPIPRIGGLVVFVSFYATVLGAFGLFDNLWQARLPQCDLLLFSLGSIVAFMVGLVDDLHRLRPVHKLMVQLIAAGLAYAGGIRIESIGFYAVFQIELGWLSPVVSLFWIVLVINAFNLIDGLDGLVGGVGLIAAAILGAVSFQHNAPLETLLMTTLAGCLLGFLRYNFYPASIFMGDGGSYFLGYLLGTVSILAALPNPTTMTILAPMLAVSLPVIDVGMAVIRRFVCGRAIFSPDKGHFHHMLLQHGLSHRVAVLVLYGVALFICACALALLKFRDERALFLLLLIGCTLLFGMSRLGYFQGYNARDMLPWIMEISDGLGLSRSRRTFFNLQLKIGSSENLNELFRHLETTMAYLDLSVCALYLTPQPAHTSPQPSGMPPNAEDRRQMTPLYTSITHRLVEPDWLWHNPEHTMDQLQRRLFRVEMDLFDDEGHNFGALVLLKNQALGPISHYTLHRIEHLRRSILKALEKIGPKDSSKGLRTED